MSEEDSCHHIDRPGQGQGQAEVSVSFFRDHQFGDDQGFGAQPGAGEVACSHIATRKKKVLAQMMTMACRLSVSQEDMSISMMTGRGRVPAHWRSKEEKLSRVLTGSGSANLHAERYVNQ